MYTFSQFLEAVMGRSAIPMDQDDVDYLNQFPKNFWPDAIKQRYNDLLLQAIARGTSDPVNVKVRTARKTGEGGIKQLQINARMDKVLSKLKNLGFDLSDPHPETQTLSNMKLMNRDQAQVLIKNWLNYSTQAGQEGLVPGYARFTPTRLERGVQSYDDPYDSEAKSKWATISADVMDMANNLMRTYLKRMSRPEDPYYINSFYWRERPDEIMQGLIKRIKDNLANPEIMDRKVRYKIMSNHMHSLSQTGHVSRRMLERAKKEGVDIPKLIKKGYTISQITDAIKNAYVGGIKHGATSTFNFNIGNNPQQQDFLKNIHQSAETPNSAIANYGKRTIGALRQQHSQQVMQNPEMQQKVTPYKLAPEPWERGLPTQQQYQQLARQAAQKQQKKAARDISDIISFKDWVYALG